MWNRTYFLKGGLSRILHLTLLLSLVLQSSLQARNDKIGPELSAGVNTNLILDQTDFKSGFTGIGLNAENLWGNGVSVSVFINTFAIEANNSGISKTGYNELRFVESGACLRIRINDGKIRFFSQIGVGIWGWVAGNYFLGAGADLSINEKYNIVCILDYLIVDSDMYTESEKKSWTSSMFRLNFSLALKIF